MHMMAEVVKIKCSRADIKQSANRDPNSKVWDPTSNVFQREFEIQLRTFTYVDKFLKA
jgi:hypothetical protein